MSTGTLLQSSSSTPQAPDSRMLPRRLPFTAQRARCRCRNSICTFFQRMRGTSNEISIEADPLPSLDAERPLAEAHREPLREQLRRGAAAPERHHRAAGIARFRHDAGLRHQRAEARGAGRAQFHAAARALFRQHGRRRQGDQGRCPRRSRATSARCSAGAPSFPPWATPSAAARAGCCSPGCRATGA